MQVIEEDRTVSQERLASAMCERIARVRSCWDVLGKRVVSWERMSVVRQTQSTISWVQGEDGVGTGVKIIRCVYQSTPLEVHVGSPNEGDQPVNVRQVVNLHRDLG